MAYNPEGVQKGVYRTEMQALVFERPQNSGVLSSRVSFAGHITNREKLHVYAKSIIMQSMPQGTIAIAQKPIMSL
jgi:hypothetical protein